MRSDQNATFPAHYYDGQSAMARKAVVRFSTNVIVISDADGVAASWSYGGLLAPDPVTPNRSSRITHRDSPYARLVVDDPGFAIGILERAPHLSTHERRVRTVRIVAACVGVAVVMMGLGWAFLSYAPRIVATAIPDTWRVQLGEQIEQSVVSQARLCGSAQGTAALAILHDRLLDGQAEASGVQIRVYDLDVINAFALPGGRIIVSRSLIETATGPDAVAGVLAHEIGHVIERDSETQIVRSMGITLLQQALFGGGSSITDAMGGAAGFLTLMRYSRAAEREADRHAVRLLRSAGINKAGLAGFFRYMEEQLGDIKEGGKLGALISLVSSHPNTGERADAIDALEGWPSEPALDAQQWAALKGICSQ